MKSFSYEDSILLSRWVGRFGNRMFSYLFGMDYALRRNLTLLVPSVWEGTYLFRKSRVALIPDEDLRRKLIHSVRKFESTEKRREIISQHPGSGAGALRYIDPDRDFDSVRGAVFYEKMGVQSIGVFQNYTLKRIREIFSWADMVRQSDLFRRYEDAQGSYVVAHLRRGDIADIKKNQKRDSGYSVLSRESYLRAFHKFGVDPDSVSWVTDDRSGMWGGTTKNNQFAGWKYPEGSRIVPDRLFDWFEDFLRIYFAGTIFRANSSFSWWASCLSPCAKVYSPVVPCRRLYLKEEDALDVDFVEGNEPHWLNPLSSAGPKQIVIQ